MASRTDVNELGARIALLTNIPIALPPAWVAKRHADLGGQIIERNLLAGFRLDPDAKTSRYVVPGRGATTVLGIETAVNAPTNTSTASVAIGLHHHGETTLDPVWLGRDAAELARMVDGFVAGIEMLRKLGAEGVADTPPVAG